MDKERKQRTHHRGVRRLLATRQIDTQPAPDTSHFLLRIPPIFCSGYPPFSAPDTSHFLLRIPPIFCSGYLPFLLRTPPIFSGACLPNLADTRRADLCGAESVKSGRVAPEKWRTFAAGPEKPPICLPVMPPRWTAHLPFSHWSTGSGATLAVSEASAEGSRRLSED